jgi:hypothetical protein
MNREQHELVRKLRRRLEGRAFLADDPRAYREGVDDALGSVEAALDPPGTIDITDRALAEADRPFAAT